MLGLAPGYSLSEALSYLEGLVEELLPEAAVVGYRGDSLKYKESSSSVVFVFGLALLVVFLVLAAQFESFRASVHDHADGADCGGGWVVWVAD
jgi:multidrug efflux pump